MKKKILSVLLVSILSVLLISPAATLAKSNVGFTKKSISLDQLPDGAVPIFFDSQEEADAFIQKLDNNIQRNNKYAESFIKSNNLDFSKAPVSAVSIAAATGYSYNALAGQYNDSFPSSPYCIKLWCNYTTSGDHSGTILSASCYTTVEGIIWPNKWEQSTAYANIGYKDISCYALGTMTFYIFVGGIGDIYSWNVTITGSVAAIR